MGEEESSRRKHAVSASEVEAAAVSASDVGMEAACSGVCEVEASVARSCRRRARAREGGGGGGVVWRRRRRNFDFLNALVLIFFLGFLFSDILTGIWACWA